MKETYIRLRTNAPPDTVEIDPEHLLEDIYRSLNCESIEIVHVTSNYRVIADEYGKFNQKRFNQFASALFSNSTRYYHIFGDVLIANLGSHNGELKIIPLSKQRTADELQYINTIWNRIHRENREEI